MSTEIKIETLAEYLNEIQPPSDTTELRYIYRGQKDKTWQVRSSAMRRLLKLKKPSHPNPLQPLFIEYHRQIIDEITLCYASTYSNMKPLECMAHLQHNRVATGLIDFTYSPLVALWFACEADNPKDEDGKVFMLDTHSTTIEEIKTREALEKEKSLETFFCNDGKWYLWQPSIGNPTIDTERITIQQSVFMFGIPEATISLFEKTLIIPQNCKEKLLKELATAGIMEKTLFPDLAGFLERNSSESAYNAELTEPYYTQKIKASKEIDEEQAKHYFQRANFRFALGKYDEAIKDYSKAIKHKVNYASAYDHRGNTYANKKEYDLAISDYNKAIKYKPDYAEAHLNRGSVYAYKGEYDLAISDYGKAIELKPNLAEAYNNRGIAYVHKKEYGLAIKDYNNAIALNPNDAEVYNNRGIAFSQTGERDLAIKDFTQAIETNPDFANAYLYRGIAHTQKEKHDLAIKDFTKAINVNPDEAVAYYTRAVVWLFLRCWESTQADLTTAQSLGLNIASAFQDDFGSIEKFEQGLKITIPPNIRKLLESSDSGSTPS